MGYLIVAALVVAVLYGAAGRRALRRQADWRVASAALSVALFVAAAFEGLRGGWTPGLILSLLALLFVGSARWPRASRPRPAAPVDGMSRRQACDLLGVPESADPAEIRAAYARLIQRVHPDKGGAPGLAAQLNLARDRLLKS